MEVQTFEASSGIDFPSAMMQSYENNGFLIVENFIESSVIGELKDRAYALALEVGEERLPAMHPQLKKRWSLEELEESKHHYCCYFEEPFTQLPSLTRLLKISHALHQIDPVFHEFAYSSRVQNILKALSYVAPQIVLSQLHFKPPHSSSAVELHQDATYITTRPCSTVGLWIALEDATLENGCLCIVPGEHLRGQNQQMIRELSGDLSFKILQDVRWPLENAVNLPVKAGTLIILHGLLPHYSSDNFSSQSRLSLSLHFFDLMTEYSDYNWLPFELF